MVRKRFWIFLFVVVALAAAGFFSYGYFFDDSSFTKTSLIKLNIPQGGSFESPIKISNPDNFPQNFSIALVGFSGLGSLSESDFYLDSYSEKEVVVYFEGKNNLPRTYVGELVIKGKLFEENIPVVVGVEDPDSVFTIMQSGLPKYNEVFPGGKFGVEIKVYDLVGLGLQTVYAEYEIVDLEGDVLKTGNSNLVVGSGGKTELFDIPSDWSVGDYVLVVSVSYDDAVSFSSYVFSVSNKTGEFFSNSFILLVMIILIFLLGVIASIFYFIRMRDSFLLKLKAQQRTEVKKKSNYVDKFIDEVSQSNESSEEKKKELEKLSRVKQSFIKRIKNRHRTQRREVSKLSREKKKEEIKSRLKKWSKEGSDTKKVDKEVKKALGKKSVRNQIKEWNRRGLNSKN